MKEKFENLEDVAQVLGDGGLFTPDTKYEFVEEGTGYATYGESYNIEVNIELERLSRAGCELFPLTWFRR